VRFRKEEEIRKGEGRLARKWQTGIGPAKGQRQDPDQLPQLPAGPEPLWDDLQNGLLEADYIVVEMAARSWARLAGGIDYVARANAGGIERVLV
jgi:hypothetical protein